jgi:hypothetical protein
MITVMVSIIVGMLVMMVSIIVGDAGDDGVRFYVVRSEEKK